MYTWDVQKALSNFVKHGVSFEEATTIFEDTKALHGEDIGHSVSEPRFFVVGRSGAGRTLLVIYTVRKLSNGQEAIRIISARQASRKERKAYSGQ